MSARVLIVMGSGNDAELVEPAWKVLDELGVEREVRVASAHRSPERVTELATGARQAKFGAIIAAAGGAAHLAGVVAAHTTLPVIALPLDRFTLSGMDALLSSVQMPPGIPIASVGIGGARNAGLFAAAILASTDAALADRLTAFRTAMAEGVVEADARLQQKLGAARHPS